DRAALITKRCFEPEPLVAFEKKRVVPGGRNGCSVHVPRTFLPAAALPPRDAGPLSTGHATAQRRTTLRYRWGREPQLLCPNSPLPQSVGAKGHNAAARDEKRRPKPVISAT